MRVTVGDLRKLGACAGNVEKFKAEFGSYADVTLENLARAFKAGINVDWWATQVFGSEYERVKAQALAEYERVKAQAWAEYERVKAQAWAEYERVTAPAWAEYERVTAPALAEYERVKAQALAEYKRVKAQAWAEYERVTAPAIVSLADARAAREVQP